MIKKSIKSGIGVTLIIIGFFSLFLPIFPGIVLIFLGFELLGFGLVFRDKVKKFFKKDKKDKVEENKASEKNKLPSV